MSIAPNPTPPGTVACPAPPTGLEEDIARTRMRLAWQQLALPLRAMLGLDTRRARDRLRLITDRLACLHYRRQPAPHA